jgi:hypothetical protein
LSRWKQVQGRGLIQKYSKGIRPQDNETGTVSSMEKLPEYVEREISGGTRCFSGIHFEQF